MSDTQPTLTETGSDPERELRVLSDSLHQIGFERELAAWGEEVALPWMRSHWPRPNWPPLSPATIKEKRRLGFPETALIRTGKLIRAATQRGAPGNIFETGPFSIAFGVSGGEVPYAPRQYRTRPWDDLSGPPMEELDRRLEAALEARAKGEG